ncbi:MAG TPA: SpoIIE family protein phosphatase [Nocardioidaceae bacterium]|nr:SpoIIE family protein phosphatase [Nocardioidaceae bacterium]
MLRGSGSPTLGRFTVLRRLASALGRAVTPDEVSHVALSSATHIAGVVRAGIAINQGAGRQLRFAASENSGHGADDMRWCHIDGLANVPLVRTVREGVAVFVRSADELAEHYPHMLERQHALGTRSMATLPLGDGEECLGGLLLSFDTACDFGPEQEAFLGAFAAQTGQALRRALAQQEELSTAERLQRSLMPQSVPDLDGLALGAHYHSGGAGNEVGGDWYDVLPLDDGSVLLAVGDVMGKGSSAAVVMGEVRAATRAYALLDSSPDVVLGRLDGLVRSLAVPEQMVTIVCGVIEPERQTMALSVAGHPPPLLVPMFGGPTVLHEVAGPPLGLNAGPWDKTTIDFDDDVTVLFYSNGLVETREVDVFTGLDLLCEDLGDVEAQRRTPREMCARLGDLAWRRAAEDDVTMLAVSRTRRRRLHTATTDLPVGAAACPLARRFVTSRLTEWNVDEELVETAQLCVSELVTNAIIHAGTSSQVTVRLDDERLLVSVRDHGRSDAVRPVEGEEPTVSTGRGLTIVDVLSTTWSSERSVDGTTVWFELDVPSRATTT